jgi:hypothetical protein
VYYCRRLGGHAGELLRGEGGCRICRGSEVGIGRMSSRGGMGARWQAVDSNSVVEMSVA